MDILFVTIILEYDCRSFFEKLTWNFRCHLVIGKDVDADLVTKSIINVLFLSVSEFGLIKWDVRELLVIV